MQTPVFKTARTLANIVSAYFRYIQGEYRIGTKSGTEQKTCIREPEPATITGLALFIGFNSRQELEFYEQNGEFGSVISRSRLRIEALYEKKLHQNSPSGAIFALKNMGWIEKPGEHSMHENQPVRIKIEIIDSGAKIAESELEVMI